MFVCGTSVFPLFLLEQAMYKAGYRLRVDNFMGAKHRHMQNIFTPRRRSEDKMPDVGGFVVRFTDSQCSNAHDRVYALLGMIRGCENFPVD